MRYCDLKFGENYTVEKPENASKCIVVRKIV